MNYRLMLIGTMGFLDGLALTGCQKKDQTTTVNSTLIVTLMVIRNQCGEDIFPSRKQHNHLEFRYLVRILGLLQEDCCPLSGVRCRLKRIYWEKDKRSLTHEASTERNRDRNRILANIKSKSVSSSFFLRIFYIRHAAP